MSRFLAGLDLAQVNDYSALMVVEKVEDLYAVRHAQRWRGTPYPALVGQVAEVLSRPPLAGNVSLNLDATGVGRPVLDLFMDAYAQGKLPCSPRAITITSGEESTYTTVPKKDLVSRLEVLLSNGRLLIAADLPLAGALKEELLSFTASVKASGHVVLEAAGSGHHDDLVLALCLAVWEGGRPVLLGSDTITREHGRLPWRSGWHPGRLMTEEEELSW